METKENIREQIRIYQLTRDSVYIDIERFVTVEGHELKLPLQVKPFRNSVSGRERLQNELPDWVVNSVFAAWGDEPTYKEPEMSKPSDETTEPPLPDNESKNSNSIKTSIEKDENL